MALDQVRGGSSSLDRKAFAAVPYTSGRCHLFSSATARDNCRHLLARVRRPPIPIPLPPVSRPSPSPSSRRQAKDNVKFLNTLERHFRAITGIPPPVGPAPLQPLVDTLPSMMTADHPGRGLYMMVCIILQTADGPPKPL